MERRTTTGLPSAGLHGGRFPPIAGRAFEALMQSGDGMVGVTDGISIVVAIEGGAGAADSGIIATGAGV